MARKAVPYSGPEAPPTRDTSVVPARNEHVANGRQPHTQPAPP